MPPPALYANAVAIGEKKAHTPASTTLKLSILSGAHIGLGGLLAMTIGGNMAAMGKENPGLQKLLFGLFGLPFGLYCVVCAGGELFTGNTALVSAAYYEGKATLKELGKSWSVSYFGNLIGSFLVLALMWSADMGGAAGPIMDIAIKKTSNTFFKTFLKGIVCNWLVCLAVWVSVGCSTLTEKYLAAVLPVSAFVAFGAEHSVANMFLIPLGKYHGANISWSDVFLKNLLPVTLGNILGGAVLQSGVYATIYGTLFKPKAASVPAAKK